MGKIVNQAELEQITGYTHTTLWEWQTKEGMPVVKVGAVGEANEYDTAAVIAWLMDRAIRKSGKESTRDRLTRAQAEHQEMENAQLRGELVPASQVEPIWRNRVLAAAGFMASRHSRLAGLLEAAPGLEAKRTILKQEDAAFLTRLGVDGERMQAEIDALLERFSEAEAAALLKRIAGNEPDRGTPDSTEDGMGGIDPAGKDPAQ